MLHPPPRPWGQGTQLCSKLRHFGGEPHGLIHHRRASPVRGMPRDARRLIFTLAKSVDQSGVEGAAVLVQPQKEKMVTLSWVQRVK